MTHHQLITALREELKDVLQEMERSWGRDEILLAFERALTRALLRFIDTSYA